MKKTLDERISKALESGDYNNVEGAILECKKKANTEMNLLLQQKQSIMKDLKLTVSEIDLELESTEKEVDMYLN